MIGVSIQGFLILVRGDIVEGGCDNCIVKEGVQMQIYVPKDEILQLSPQFRNLSVLFCAGDSVVLEPHLRRCSRPAHDKPWQVD